MLIGPDVYDSSECEEGQPTDGDAPSRPGVLRHSCFTQGSQIQVSQVSPSAFHFRRRSNPNRAELDEIWQDTLLGQFHDCLPGTTIKMVVNDNLDIYERRGEQARKLIDEALTSLTGHPSASSQTDIESTRVIDPQRSKRNESIKLDSGKVAWLETDHGGIGKLSSAKPDLQPPRVKQEGDCWILSNAKLRLTLSSGRIASLFDLSLHRELILPGPGAEDGGLMLYEDYPLAYDAWDVEIYHLQSYQPIRFDKVKAEEGDLRASLIASATFGKSIAKFSVRDPFNMTP